MVEHDSVFEVRYLTVTEAALALHLSKSLVYREIHQGRLRCHRFGARCYRIAVGDLHRYQALNTIPQSGSSAKSLSRQITINQPKVLRHICWKRSPVEQT
jgi:excisionase family DNA binding protein